MDGEIIPTNLPTPDGSDLPWGWISSNSGWVAANLRTLILSVVEESLDQRLRSQFIPEEYT